MSSFSVGIECFHVDRTIHSHLASGSSTSLLKNVKIFHKKYQFFRPFCIIWCIWLVVSVPRTDIAASFRIVVALICKPNKDSSRSSGIDTGSEETKLQEPRSHSCLIVLILRQQITPVQIICMITALWNIQIESCGDAAIIRKLESSTQDMTFSKTLANKPMPIPRREKSERVRGLRTERRVRNACRDSNSSQTFAYISVPCCTFSAASAAPKCIVAESEWSTMHSWGKEGYCDGWVDPKQTCASH